MNAYKVNSTFENGDKYDQVQLFLQGDDGYWLDNDTWNIRDSVFTTYGVSRIRSKSIKQIHFSTFKEERLKNEAKYYIAYSLKNQLIAASSVFNNFKSPIEYFASFMNNNGQWKSFDGVKISDIQMIQFLEKEWISTKKADDGAYKNHLRFKNGLSTFITSYYDVREETEKDVWNAINIPGARISAAEKSGVKRSLSFKEIPAYYREMTKCYLRRLVTRRSWSYCSEMLIYIRYFFNSFYQHNYEDGFLKRLKRAEMETYLLWIANDYHDKNATYRSKAVSFIQAFIWYIQLAQYLEAPITAVEKLIYSDDYPRRERAIDTLQKVKYIPTPVKEQLDAALYELEPAEMIPIYILLRETGWRGTDILNIRHQNCLDYHWNAVEGKYVIYLCGEITKTSIPSHKIPIRGEVGEMVKKLVEKAKLKSTVENNPDGYLFNTYEGRNKGMPLSKLAFVKSVKNLIEKNSICDAEGKTYHFRTHSMRHTRAMEYTEQGMPIGVIQQILGHCSLQMTLHYSKVSENAIYEKWKETVKLNLFHLKDSCNSEKVGTGQKQTESVDYEYVKKNLDAVRVPFGTCFKPTKIVCRQQMIHCLECPSFCSTSENILEFEEEIKRVSELIDISQKNKREDWEKKNTEYLNILKKMLERISNEGIVHKNGNLREEH